MPELPAGMILLPGQRTARDDVVVAAKATVGAAAGRGTRRAAGADAPDADSSRWFDWRRARGIGSEPEPEPEPEELEPEPGPEPRQEPASPQAATSGAPPDASSGAAAEPDEGPQLSRWFRSTAL